MIPRRSMVVTVIWILMPALCLAQQIAVGTVLPVMSTKTLNSAKSKPGESITARLSQDVSLASGERLRAGAVLHGEVVASSATANSPAAHLSVRFDRLIAGGRELPLRVSLRALASMGEVFDAQLPWNTVDDYGTSTSDWNTVQVGGAAVYRGDGTVRSAMDVIGHTTDYGAVTAKLQPAPKRGCPANPTDGEREQSLWVFSPSACGPYGFDDLAITHHGATNPIGTIELTAPKAIVIRAGSGWLLRVVQSPAQTGGPTAP